MRPEPAGRASRARRGSAESALRPPFRRSDDDRPPQGWHLRIGDVHGRLRRLPQVRVRHVLDHADDRGIARDETMPSRVTKRPGLIRSRSGSRSGMNFRVQARLTMTTGAPSKRSSREQSTGDDVMPNTSKNSGETTRTRPLGRLAGSVGRFVMSTNAVESHSWRSGSEEATPIAVAPSERSRLSLLRPGREAGGSARARAAAARQSPDVPLT